MKTSYIRFRTGTKCLLVFCKALNVLYVDDCGSGFQADVSNVLYDCFQLGQSSFSRPFPGGTRPVAAADRMLCTVYFTFELEPRLYSCVDPVIIILKALLQKQGPSHLKTEECKENENVCNTMMFFNLCLFIQFQ